MPMPIFLQHLLNPASRNSEIEASCGARYYSGSGTWGANASVESLNQIIRVDCSLDDFVFGWCKIVVEENEKIDGQFTKLGWQHTAYHRLRPFSVNVFTVTLSPQMPDCPGKDPNPSIKSERKLEIIDVGVVYFCSEAARQSEADSCADCGEPIDVTDGRVHQTATDVSIPAPGIPLEFTRSYSSQLTGNEHIGAKWTHNYAAHVYETNKVFTYSSPSGVLGTYTNTWFVFCESGVQHWKPVVVQSGGEALPTAPSGPEWTPIRNADGSSRIEMQGGLEYQFDTNGVLVMLSDQFNNFVVLSYSNAYPNHRLTQAQHSNGQRLQFAYSDGRISEVTTPSANLSVFYAYNNRGELTNRTRMVNGQSLQRTYYYDACPQVWTHCMTQMLTEAGSRWCWEYEQGSNGVLTERGIRTWLAQSNRYDMTVNYANADIGISQVMYHNQTQSNRYQYEFNPLTKRIQAIYGPNSSNSIDWRGVRYDQDAYGNRIKTHMADYRQHVMESADLYTFYDPSGRFMTNRAYGLMAPPTNNWVYNWNTNNQLLASIEDPLGNRTEFAYTNSLLLRRTQYAEVGHPLVTAYGYSTNGLLTLHSNANGHVATYEYDSNGFLNAVIPQLGPAVMLSNNVLGQVVGMNVGGDRTLAFERNALGHITQIAYPDGTSDSFVYDDGQQVVSRTDRGGFATTNVWYPGGKLASVTRCGTDTNLTIRYDYDQQGNSLTIIDEAGRSVEQYELDDVDRPVQISNVDTQTLHITYGLGRYVKNIQRFDGTIISNKFNGNGWLAIQQVVNPVTGEELAIRKDYYNNGRLMHQAALQSFGSGYATNASLSNAWDGAGRLLRETMSTPEITWQLQRQYDGVGHVTNLLETQLGGISRTYAYDAAERLHSVTGDSGVFSVEYDALTGNLDMLQYPNGVKACYQYDLMDRLTQISHVASGAVTQQVIRYAYDARGSITQKVCTTAHAARTNCYTYDDFNRLTQEVVYTNGSLISDQQWQYDATGNRLSKNTGPGEVTYYSADIGNRLTAWSFSQTNTILTRLIGSSSEPIGTDGRWGQLWVSNATAHTPWISGTNFGVDQLTITNGENRIISAIRDQAGNTAIITNLVNLTAHTVTNGTYSYNPAGCLTQLTYRSEAETRTVNLTWDLNYQLKQLTSSAGSSSFEYGADGRMIKRTENGVVAHLIYDGVHLLAEVDRNLFVTRRYTYGPGVDNILSMTVTTNGQSYTYYYLKDHQNSVVALTDESGEMVESYSYNAWGRTTVYDANGTELTESAFGNRVCWQGREINWNTGLYCFRARWYDPITGRFLSKDPIGISGGLNQYVFCHNNPINRTDPLGLCESESDSYVFSDNPAVGTIFDPTLGSYFAGTVFILAPEPGTTVLGLLTVGHGLLTDLGMDNFQLDGNLLPDGAYGDFLNYLNSQKPQVGFCEDMNNQGYDINDPVDQYDYWYDGFTGGFPGF